MTSAATRPEGLTVGEFARRVGVSPHALRAWERRYGLLDPRRSAGGYRIYGPADERRVKAVLAARRSGLTTAAAVAQVLSRERAGQPRWTAPADTSEAAMGSDAVRSPATPGRPGTLQALIPDLLRATAELDLIRIQAILDRGLSISVETTISELLLPALNQVGAAWERGELGVAHEHFLSQAIRSRLGAWAHAEASPGQHVMLACPSGERHDLALLCLGVCLSRNGFAVRSFGADTPLDALAVTAQHHPPALVVLASRDCDVFAEHRIGIRRLRRQVPVHLAGPGASAGLARRLGCQWLPGDPVQAARTLQPSIRAAKRR